MFSIPLGIFLIIYGVALIIMVIFFLVNLLHLIHTGTFTFWSIAVTAAVGAFMVLVVSVTWGYIGTLDWQEPVVIWNNSGFSSTL